MWKHYTKTGYWAADLNSVEFERNYKEARGKHVQLFTDPTRPVENYVAMDTTSANEDYLFPDNVADMVCKFAKKKKNQCQCRNLYFINPNHGIDTKIT